MREEQGSSSLVETEGSTVLQEVVRMTGLSEEVLDPALTKLLGAPEGSVNQLTLDQLRDLLLQCLETMNEHMQQPSQDSGLN